MVENVISSLSALEGTLGRMPETLNLKIIDHLDEGALSWLATSSIAFLGISSDKGPVAAIAGGAPGFIGANKRTLEFAHADVDGIDEVSEGAGFGSLMLLPQSGEMLRVNGRIDEAKKDRFRVRVEECYVHCAKALIRSNFWSPEDAPESMKDSVEAVNASRFLVLVTMNEQRDVDVSPKGDPAGALAIADSDGLWLADRPGNRRADSFKNILEDSRVSGVFLRPGSTRIEYLSGTAEPTTNPIREKFVVKDRVPAIATRVTAKNWQSIESGALQRSEIWNRGKVDLDAARVLTDHIKLNKHVGFAAKLVSAITGLPGVMRRGLDSSYKRELY